jgi:hypothetical protein
MSVFDMLPKRKDGTTITPWDDDWVNDVRQGVYDAQWGRVGMDHEVVIKDVPEPVKTGEFVDPGLMLMFVEGGYRDLFKRIYGTGQERPGEGSNGADFG